MFRSSLPYFLLYIREVIFITIKDTDNIMLKENTSAIIELTV